MITVFWCARHGFLIGNVYWHNLARISRAAEKVDLLLSKHRLFEATRVVNWAERIFERNPSNAERLSGRIGTAKFEAPLDGPAVSRMEWP
jgi:hypothetical protein